MQTVIANLLCFQTVWFVCVIGAARSHDLMGVAAVALHLGLHFRLIAHSWRELWLIVAAVAVGFAVDSLLVSLGVIRFPLQPLALGMQPAWMTALWVNFALTLPHSLRWLTGRPVAAVLLGLVGGPLAYWTGDRLGALSLSDANPMGLVALAALWGAATLALCHLAQRTALRSKDGGFAR